jgi:hypothetical protein
MATSNDVKIGLDLIGQFIVEKLWRVMHDEDLVASGDLINSIRYNINTTGSSFEIQIYAEDYAENVDKGSPPLTYVSVYALAEWIENKGIVTGEKEIKNLAFAIQRTIYDKGTIQFRQNKKGFIEIMLDESAKIIFKMVLDLFKTQFTLSLTNAVRKNKQIFES